jgi:hypothetical protein
MLVATIYEDGASTVKLRRAKIECIDDAACNSSYPGKITLNMFCAGNQGTKTRVKVTRAGRYFFSSDDDPTHFMQAGIVSWGEGVSSP